jgi:signal transduction histidine kinase
LDEFTILYVDDEQPNRVVFEQSFNKKYRIRTVASAAEALAVLQGGGVAAVITDQRMPEMTGNELLKRVAAEHPETVRVVLTAYSDLDPILRAVNEGLCARYIIKPWDRAELEQIMNWALEVYRLSHDNSALQLRLFQSERLITLGSIASAVFHDLSQPLAYIQYNAQRLSELSPSMSSLDELVREYGYKLSQADRSNLTSLAVELHAIAADILTGCSVMNELTSTLRKLSRPVRGAESGTSDPVAVVRYSMSVCNSVVMSHHGKLLFEGPPELPKVRISPAELTQVMINLVANAAQALGRSEKMGGRVTVVAAEMKDVVRLTITDDGPGMPPEVLQKLGTPFFSMREDGTGLGVAQCRRIVERAGGQILFESTVGQGTTVTLNIPRAEA